MGMRLFNSLRKFSKQLTEIWAAQKVSKTLATTYL